MLLGGDAIPTPDERGNRVVGDALLVLLNAHHEALEFTLPGGEWDATWELVSYTGSPEQHSGPIHRSLELTGRSLALLRHPL